MWKEMYCFALRIDTVLPDWRGFIGLGSELLLQVARVPIGLKLAEQPHILKGTCVPSLVACVCAFAKACTCLQRILCRVDHLCMVAVC